MPLSPAANTALLTAVPRSSLSALWQVLLLGDGSLTRTFGLLTGSPTVVTVLDTSTVTVTPVDAPPEVNDLVAPIMRRCVWLQNERGERLAYAVSWWGESDYARLMPEPHLPIGTSLGTAAMEVLRRIHCVWRCNRPSPGSLGDEMWQSLCQVGTAVDDAIDVWGRTYSLVSGGRTVTVICEVFSPHLSRFIGASRDPPASCNTHMV